MLNSENIPKILRYFSDFRVSLDATKLKEFNEIRKEANYGEIIENIKRLVKKRIS